MASNGDPIETTLELLRKARVSVLLGRIHTREMQESIQSTYEKILNTQAVIYRTDETIRDLGPLWSCDQEAATDPPPGSSDADYDPRRSRTVIGFSR